MTTLLQHSLHTFASLLGGQFATELGGQFPRNIQSTNVKLSIFGFFPDWFTFIRKEHKAIKWINIKLKTIKIDYKFLQAKNGFLRLD